MEIINNMTHEEWAAQNELNEEYAFLERQNKKQSPINRKELIMSAVEFQSYNPTNTPKTKVFTMPEIDFQKAPETKKQIKRSLI